jgi:predicted alpha/beta-fold hydrolase
VGFSLGGNIVLKAAGETADDPLPNLHAVAALAPPIHVSRCVEMISHRDNWIYELNFLRELTSLARRRARFFPDMPCPRFPPRLKLREFDDLYTAPRGGFRDSADYYERSAALPHVPRIRVPTYVLTARDDPFIAVEPFEKLECPSNVLVEIVEKGGHLGFLGWDGRGGIRWAERRLADWVIAAQDPAGLCHVR